MSDWQIFIEGLKFNWVIKPFTTEWNPDLFWGLFIGTFGYVLICLICFGTASFIIGKIDDEESEF